MAQRNWQTWTLKQQFQVLFALIVLGVVGLPAIVVTSVGGMYMWDLLTGN